MSSTPDKKIAKDLAATVPLQPSLLGLLTEVLIHSFCPLLKSEIMFGDLQKEGQRFSCWAERTVSGDFIGHVGVGCDRHVPKTLATKLGLKNQTGAVDPAAALQQLLDLVTRSLGEMLLEEDFDCQFGPQASVHQDYDLPAPQGFSLLCPIETKFGEFKIFFELKPSSVALLEALTEPEVAREPRKIRVYASELETIYGYVRDIEAIERKLGLGSSADTRNELRLKVKRLKGALQSMKAEPLETLFAPARKLAVDIAKQQGKQLHFSTRGTWLFFDKAVLNFLYEPILHLIRNAIDHGIEEPLDRERVGKPATGYIKVVAAFGEKGLRLILSDDGRGFDFPKIRDRSVAKGLLSKEEAQHRLSDEIASLVFEPGFSTRDRADAISGRGLGLDIVKKGVESLGGTIRILSTSKHGTAFEINIPHLLPEISDRKASASRTASSQEDEEKVILHDELVGYFEKLTRVLAVFQSDRLLNAAYEAYRLAHSIKGTAGFLGWNRVTAFCHHYEELLKYISEQKAGVDDDTANLAVEAGEKLKEFCQASKDGITYSLFEVRGIEARIVQSIWKLGQKDGPSVSGAAPHQSMEKLHLAASQVLLMSGKSTALVTKPETDFQKAMSLPYGALVQFDGQCHGYAGLLLPEESIRIIIYPIVTGSNTAAPVKSQLWALSEFGKLMAGQILEMAERKGISLHASPPLTYYGWGQPLRILGTPTYCFSGELEGVPFYLAGDFRSPHQTPVKSEPGFHPSPVIEEAKRQCEKHFAHWNLPVTFTEVSTQSALIGFDGGATAIISCLGTKEDSQSVLFLSYEMGLAEHIHRAFSGEEQLAPETIDIFDCLNETSNIVGGLLVAELERKKIRLKLSLPTIFVGKAYVANFNRLFLTNKWVGNTPKGKFELQVLVTSLSDSK